MKKVLTFLKKEIMLVVAVLAAIVSLFITKPSLDLVKGIDWRTLGILLMMLCVLEGFKKESVLSPVVALGSRLRKMTTVTLFLVFGVYMPQGSAVTGSFLADLAITMFLMDLLLLHAMI